jgi:hypothetical protein
MALFRRPRLSLSEDARYDMERRFVTEADVWNVLDNERHERPGSNLWIPTLVIEGWDLNGRELYVVVDEKDRHRIVSVFRPDD